MGELILRSQILKEISGREEERSSQIEELEESLIEGVQQKILKGFQDELARLLKKRKDFESFRIPDEYECRKYIRQVANELGFLAKMVYFYNEKKHFFVFSVPKFRTGQPTFSQKRLIKFKKDLKKAKEQRTKKVEAECQHILTEIEKGNYEYYKKRHIATLIWLKSEIELLEEDICTVSMFFEEYGLEFYDYDFSNGNLFFYVY